jgi:glyoxylase-like metal-dependent hydrolase (beta-lactamase superfamily II)
VDIYLRAAEQQGVQIKHIFETHLHADFVSGHRGQDLHRAQRRRQGLSHRGARRL